jgi:NADPH-dependent methylglyoxal reductase
LIDVLNFQRFFNQIFPRKVVDREWNMSKSNNIFRRLILSDPEDTHLFCEEDLLAVDVGDVAAFHIIPLESPGVEGYCLFPTAGFFSDQQLLNIINKKFPELRRKIAKNQPAGAASIPSSDLNSKTLELIGGYD